MDFERGIDGMIGRMLSWLVQAPVRSTADIGRTAGSEAEPIQQDLVGLEKESLPAVAKPEPSEAGATVAKRTLTKKTTVRKSAAKKPVAKKATVRKSAATKRVAKKTNARKSVPKKPVAKKAAARKPVAKTAPKRRARKKTARADTLDAFVDAAEQAVSIVAGAVLEKADEPLDRFVESADRASGGDDDLREKLLAALSASAKGASVAELHSKTGDTLANVRRQLNQLQESGRVQRGKGIGTRYHLI